MTASGEKLVMEKELNLIMIEDSLSDLDLIQYELKKGKIKFSAQVVSTEKDFLMALEKLVPDIILSDFAMPSFDGLSALKIAKEKVPHVPFVFVSGTIGEERAIEALKSGATDYILKDHLAGLVPKLNRALNESRARLDKIQAEERLKQREMQLAEAQKVARVGSWVFDMQTNTISWSDGMYRILGISPLEITPTPDVFLSLIHPDDQSKIIEIRDESFKEMKPVAYSARIIRKDNQAIRWVHVKSEFKPDEQGNTKNVFGIMQDITEMRQAEEQLKQINKELMTFIYKASHDLRGPVSSAIGLCNMGLEDSAKIPELHNYFELMNTSLQNLDNIVLSLIQVMSIKDGKAKREKINFDGLIEDIIFHLKHAEGFSRVKFKIETLCKEIHSDPRMITSIFQNLIENAVKYQNYRIPDPEIRIRTMKRKGMIQVEISDNGVGIEDNVKDHVFDMFFRGHIGSKGSGLGLYITRNAVEVLNGSIRLESVPRKGTTFIIEFPANEMT